MLIIVGREYEGLYQGLKARQEAKGQGPSDPRPAERRAPSSCGPSPQYGATYQRPPHSRCPTPSAR